MIPKSKIRQTALNVIYAVISNGGDPQALDWELLWDICSEKETDRLRLDVCKVLDHVCRGNADSARMLEIRASSVLTAMEGDLTSAPLREKLERYTKRSSEFDAALGAMRYSVKDKRRDSSFPLELRAHDVINLATIVVGLGEELLPSFADFPAYSPVLDPLAAVVNRRAKHLSICSSMRELTTLRDNKEFFGLARAAQDLEELRPAVKDFAMQVLNHRTELDAMLDSLLQNYSTERLDVLDKCILYIALYELKFNRLEVPIVISEATILADSYSGGKSAPFIHGIIAAASVQS